MWKLCQKIRDWFKPKIKKVENPYQNITTRYTTTEEDWMNIRILSTELKNSPWTTRLGYTEKELWRYFCLAATMPSVWGVITVYDKNKPVVVAFMQKVQTLEVFETEYHAFIIGVYARKPERGERFLLWTDVMINAMRKWGRDHGCNMLQGNRRFLQTKPGASLRVPGLFALHRRYGFTPNFVQIVAPL